jgi:hypothetical protein
MFLLFTYICTKANSRQDEGDSFEGPDQFSSTYYLTFTHMHLHTSTSLSVWDVKEELRELPLLDVCNS